MLHLHPEVFIDASATLVPAEKKTTADASEAFVAAMDNLIDGLKEIEAEFLVKAAERSEKLKSNMLISKSV